MRKNIFIFLTFAILSTGLDAAAIKAGPMLGYAEMREVALWVQTTEKAKVHVSYWPVGTPNEKKQTQAVETNAETAYTAKLIANQVNPGTSYAYRVSIDGKEINPTHTQRFQTPPFWREHTPPPNVKIAFGGGHYVNEKTYDPPYAVKGDKYEIFGKILEHKPAGMVWLGNNVYLREADWGSRSGYQQRYSHNRAHPELQALLASIHHYATWASFDYGPANSDHRLLQRDNALETFQLFWPNPNFGTNTIPGVYTKFRWSDADFFLLDNRYYRKFDPDDIKKNTVLSQQQLDWLMKELISSKATFKVIIMGCPILNPVESPENFAFAKKERNQFLERIRDRKIEGLLFISGGSSYGELTKFVRSGGYDIYEVTVGNLTHRTGEEKKDFKYLNYLRVPGTYVDKRHFVTISFEGDEGNRLARIAATDSNGSEIWNHRIEANRLK